MPKNTRVHRCVEKLRRKYGYPGAIGICQRSTKQSYRTGRTLRKRRRKRKRRGGNPIKWYKTWRRRQEGQRKRRIVRRNRKRERMVKEVAAQLWAEEPEEDFDANATARRLLRLSHWHPEMAMHYWYEAHPDQDIMRVVDRAVGAAPTSVPEGGARKKRKSRVRHRRSRKKRGRRKTRKQRGGEIVRRGPADEQVPAAPPNCSENMFNPDENDQQGCYADPISRQCLDTNDLVQNPINDKKCNSKSQLCKWLKSNPTDPETRDEIPLKWRQTHCRNRRRARV